MIRRRIREVELLKLVTVMVLEELFSEYFGFPCQFSFHRLLHTHHLSSGAIQ
jgi:hypothetical protein